MIRSFIYEKSKVFHIEIPIFDQIVVTLLNNVRGGGNPKS